MSNWKFSSTWRYHFYIHKNTVYKNIEAGIYQKINNMLRIFKAEISKNVKNIEPQVEKTVFL